MQCFRCPPSPIPAPVFRFWQFPRKFQQVRNRPGYCLLLELVTTCYYKQERGDMQRQHVRPPYAPMVKVEYGALQR